MPTRQVCCGVTWCLCCTDWNQTLYGAPSPAARGQNTFILPLTLQYVTPGFLSIVGIGAISAAVMSSADSALLSATSVFSSNIYKNIFRKQVRPRQPRAQPRAHVPTPLCVTPPQASDWEMQWVIRVSVVVVGVLGTSITFYTNSTLLLWILGADISYTLIFPHLVSVLFFQVTNGYGAFVGYVIGLILRILLGENAIGLPVTLQLPGCTLQDGVHVQKAPVRTFSMLSTLLSILLFSWLASLMFNHGLLPERWDAFNVRRASPGSDAARRNDLAHRNDQSREAGGEAERDVNVSGLVLQPML